MTREPVIEAVVPSLDDPDRELRPQRLNDVVGQRDVLERLHIAVDAALKRNDVLGHVLFDGPPGLGKTTLATCIPREMNVAIQYTTGAAITAPKDLVPYLTNAEERSVLFIDEIHRLPSAVEEYLYTAMEDFRIDIVHGDGTNARTINLWLKPFTLIGATTRAGMLSAPLRDRFHVRETLEFYSDEELTQIVRRSASKLQSPIDEASAVLIAQRSRGTPRVANNRLRWVRDFATSRANGAIDLGLTEAALAMAGIDCLGLGRQERKYMETLIRVFQGGPAGLEAIAHTMNASPDTLEDEVEPYLLRSGLVVRSPRGRMVTSNGFQHMQIPPPAQANPGQSHLFD
ncbi:MAG: Holliday junction branch migration DNA helicase RuvB [Planctomycetota bacterium]|nr:Holliday junction branch migration DNA helicase RuvB [Planctomycetota bacterium]